MSYILDALRKADRERNLGEVPDLEASHWGVRHADGARRWLWIVAVLLIFNAVLLAWMFGRSDRDMVATQDMREVPAYRPLAPAATPAADETVALPLTDNPATPVKVVRPRLAIPPRAEPSDAERQETAAETAPRVVQSSVPLSDQAAAPGQVPDIPELGELPLEFRSSFQPPRIDVHVFSERPERRFVLVELQKFREGDTLASGAVLEKIQPDGVQLFYGGRHFRILR